jgi:hypothetical protein
MTHKLLNLACQSAVGMLILTVAFMAIEPTVSFAVVTSSQFTVSQTVTSEVSFATLASNVSMTPNLGGLTGGTSNGATSVNVLTNNRSGYNMVIQSSTSLGMQGSASTTNYIPAYTTNNGVAGVPDYAFRTDINGFGYAVNASTTSDVAQSFRTASAGSGPCNAGTNTSSSACWLAATSSQTTIINRNTPTTTSRATTTLSFRVNLIPNSMLPNDTYVATTTLTVNVNP